MNFNNYHGESGVKCHDYYKWFSKEEICIRILKEIEEPQGLVCKKCENETFYWMNDKKGLTGKNVSIDLDLVSYPTFCRLSRRK